MASFSFGFFPESSSSSSPLPVMKETAPDDSKPVPPHTWLDAKTVRERVTQQMIYTEIPIPPDTLRCVDVESIQDVDRNQQSTSDRPTDVWKQTDLQPTVYEGGMKVWECSLDLARYLATNYKCNDQQKEYSTVLEIGAGHALPACYMLLQSAKDSRSDFQVYVTDYNDFVVERVTTANLILNTSSVMDNVQQVMDYIEAHVHVGHGDWKDIQLPDLVDLLLASETLYTEQAANDTAMLLQKHLNPNGIGLVATKRYYFGVGGGTDSFREACEKQQLIVEVVESIDSGSGNIRDILRIKKA